MDCFLCYRQIPVKTFRSADLCMKHYYQFKSHLNLKISPQQRQNWCYNNGMANSKKIEYDIQMNEGLQKIKNASLKK